MALYAPIGGRVASFLTSASSQWFQELYPLTSLWNPCHITVEGCPSTGVSLALCIRGTVSVWWAWGQAGPSGSAPSFSLAARPTSHPFQKHLQRCSWRSWRPPNCPPVLVLLCKQDWQMVGETRSAEGLEHSSALAARGHPKPMKIPWIWEMEGTAEGESWDSHNLCRQGN